MLPPRWDTQNLIVSHRLNEQWAQADQMRLGARLGDFRKRFAAPKVAPPKPRLQTPRPHTHPA
jgi:hypothetical protein